MATESLQLTETFPATPERIWRAWLDSKEHTEMTGGGETSIQPAVGAAFRASDGYIVGMNVELEPFRRIVQTWRTTEFPPGAAHSRLEILLDPEGDGTRLSLLQTDIPEGQAEQYREAWRDYYFLPMKDYFEAHAQRTSAPAAPPFDVEAEVVQPGPGTRIEVAATVIEFAPASQGRAQAATPASAQRRAAPKKAPARRRPAPGKASAPVTREKAAPAKKAGAKKGSTAQKPAGAKKAAAHRKGAATSTPRAGSRAAKPKGRAAAAKQASARPTAKGGVGKAAAKKGAAKKTAVKKGAAKAKRSR